MRCAFVVQLRNVSQGTSEKMEGSVEEVDSGSQLYFYSEHELIAFLREHFTRSRQSLLRNGRTE
jgi:hypothetical protein